MNKLSLLLLVLLVAAGCHDKEELPPPVNTPGPSMRYTELNDKEVKKGQAQVIDVDHDGKMDFVFFVTYIGDPIFKQDKVRFSLGSNIHSLLFVGDDNNSPVLSKGALISSTNQAPYEWFILSEVFLAEKIITDENPPFWQGPWKDVKNKYISIQVKKEDGTGYSGWIEFSFDTAGDKIILHKAAISLEAGKDVKAGV